MSDTAGYAIASLYGIIAFAVGRYKENKMTESLETGKKCDRPPKGWYCEKVRGHRGPCPTIPTRWTQLVLLLRGWTIR